MMKQIENTKVQQFKQINNISILKCTVSYCNLLYCTVQYWYLSDPLPIFHTPLDVVAIVTNYHTLIMHS